MRLWKLFSNKRNEKITNDDLHKAYIKRDKFIVIENQYKNNYTEINMEWKWSAKKEKEKKEEKNRKRTSYRIFSINIYFKILGNTKKKKKKRKDLILNKKNHAHSINIKK